MMTTFSAKSAVIDKAKKATLTIYIATLALLVVITVVLSLSPAYNIIYYFNPLVVTEEARYSINGVPQGVAKLPYTITGLQPGDEVSVFLTSSGNERDCLLVETDNAKCMLTINDAPYFVVGNNGTFPAFQKEPPRSIDIVALPNIAAGNEIRFEYTLSSIANSLTINSFYSGDQNLITKHILVQNYLALILSLMILVLGASIAIIGLVLYSRAEFAIMLFWLGLTCLACGSWTFFANDVILLFFSQFSVFYSISYIGLFLLPIPLSRLCLFYVMPYHPRSFDAVFITICVLVAATMVSHVSGFISFAQMEFYFSLIGCLLLVLYIFIVLRARQKGKVTVSPLFLIGIALLVSLGLFDTFSHHIGIMSPTGVFFMLGLFLATGVIVLLMWENLRNALDAMEKNARLEADISAINRSLDLQRKHFQEFSQSAEETRRMRHDLRHQIVAIKGLIKDGKEEAALEYIDLLSTTIPSISEMLICDNAVVNSLAVYYLAQAEAEGILCDMKMAVPPVVGDIPDADLSIIVGNLLENAMEACMYVEPDKRFIKVRCNTTPKRFTLVIDNSFDGELQVSSGDFYSRKRRGFGVGIASVRSVVGKYDGSMKYETESGIFKTSLYVKLKSTGEQPEAAEE